MAEYKDWLEAIGKMVPNTQAVAMVFVTEGEGCSDKKFYWPTKELVSDELHSILSFSISQSSSSTSTVSGENYRMVLPVLSTDKAIVCYLGIEINLAGSTQNSVKRIIEWSSLWLSLLLQQEQDLHSQKKMFAETQGAFAQSAEVAADVESDQAPEIPLPESNSSINYPFLKRYKYPLITLMFALTLLIPIEYRISVNAVIEGVVESPVIAPFDGYIKSSLFKAGDLVEKSAVIAELDERDIFLKLQKLKGEFQEKDKSYRQVLASGERSKAEVLKAKISQLSVQIETITLSLNQTELRSRISGMVIAGDLSRSIGAPVKQGDVLFKVAPLDQYRTMLRIRETDIRFMQQGLNAELKLTSLPSTNYSIELLKPSPYFSDENNEVVYLAEAVMKDGNYSELRPGMEGIAKVSVGTHSLGWTLFHHFSDWLSMKVWMLKP